MLEHECPVEVFIRFLTVARFQETAVDRIRPHFLKGLQDLFQGVLSASTSAFLERIEHPSLFDLQSNWLPKPTEYKGVRVYPKHVTRMEEICQSYSPSHLGLG